MLVKHNYYGKTYECYIFQTVEETNNWLTVNKDWGVLTVGGDGLIYVARISDNGKKS